MEKKRLNKILAEAGVASRRNADILISEGRVCVNGEVCKTLGSMFDPKKDSIAVDGRHITKKIAEKITYVLNKPTGYICSCKRHGDDKLAIDLIKDRKRRLYTIGRLDKTTEGLILVTNDGDFANYMMHPSSNIEREYIVEVKEELTPVILDKVRKGTYIENKKIVPKKVSLVKKKSLSIIVTEGKKHEVRIIIERSRLSLTRLKRIRIGSLTLGSMPKGVYRILSTKEKRELLKKTCSEKSSKRNTI